MRRDFGLNQGQHFGRFIQRAESAGHHDIGVRVFDERDLAREEMAKAERNVRPGIVRLLVRQLMFRPTDGDLPSNAPLLAASMMPGPPPEITAKPASDRRRAISSASI